MVHIKEISVQGLGPLQENSFSLGKLNLFYGKNETGKTLLVEFILQSLFRHATCWQLRDLPGQGKITLSGFGDIPAVFPAPDGRKLEDFWEEEERGLPLNFSRLLVVKGGELALDQFAPGGVNKEFLKNTLTRQHILDEIRERIQTTIQKASVEKQTIQGDHRGAIKERAALISKRQRLTKLLNDLNQSYSQGPLTSLEADLEALKKEFTQQQQAKRHLAYQLRQDLAKRKINQSALPGETLDKIQSQLRNHQQFSDQIHRLENKISSLEESSRYYLWIEESIHLWEEKQLSSLMPPNSVLQAAGLLFFFLGLILFFAGIVFKSQGLTWAAFLGLLTSLGLAWLTSRKMQTWAENRGKTEEQEAIADTFQELFNYPLRGLADLKLEAKKLQARHIKKETLLESLQEYQKRKQESAAEISQCFQEISPDPVSQQDWTTQYQSLLQKSEKEDQEIRQVETRLAELGISKEEQLPSPPGAVYNPDRLYLLESQIKKKEELLLEAENQLRVLKSRAARELGADLTTPWTDLFSGLIEMNAHLDEEYRRLTAHVLAGIGISRVLDEIQLEEDQRIHRHLQSKQVSSLVFQLTGRYKQVFLQDDQLIMSDPYQDYPLRQLSTGAQEQIQLALRVGVASQLTQGKPMFLILDDAFQHSDWDRREELVRQASALSKLGWQVIYLSMDDHIRDLFCEQGENVDPDYFRYFPLD